MPSRQPTSACTLRLGVASAKILCTYLCMCICSVRLHRADGGWRPEPAACIRFLFPVLRKRRKMQVNNGTPADQLISARWRKAEASNPTGSCVEVAALDGG